MKRINFGQFYRKVSNKIDQHPLTGHIDLTYRCNFDCIHCYCKGSEDRGRELTTAEWKEIFDEIHREGCMWLTFSGGDPLVRDDFLELYAYAKKKGFIITLFTNGQAFTDKIVDYLVKSPPYLIEITLNGITRDTYEVITRVKGSFERVMGTIKDLNKKGIRLILKSNCLKQNKDEIAKIKVWAEENLGKPPKNKYRFKYDTVISPRLNGDISPCQCRLSFEEFLEAKKQDPDIWEEYEKGLHRKIQDITRDRNFLYHCNAWMTQFFINPYGRLKFCIISDKFSVDLKTTPFREGFFNVFPRILNQRFKTNSKCQYCDLRALCYHCPARAYLETGDEEAPMEYYCRLAEEIKKQREALNCSK